MIYLPKRTSIFDDFDPSKPLNPSDFERPRAIYVAAKGPICLRKKKSGSFNLLSKIWKLASLKKSTKETEQGF